MNCFLEYYDKHNISPVKQKIDDIEIHHKKREKLYRQLGMPPIVFKDKDILEIGPGSEYNTLSFFEWGGKMTLVEPNRQGIKELKELFKEKGIKEDSYVLHECMIEQFKSDKKYDIVIAEGFLHSIDNAYEIIQQISDLVKEGGVVVITCMDYCSTFVEQMKRLVCHILIEGEEDYEKKVEICKEFFEPQFKDVIAMSRSVEDWVKDDMLNPAFNSDTLLGIADGIQCFSEEFEYLGTSQRMFTDYSWYKDIDYDERANVLKQYKRKRHNLLMTGMEETVLSNEESEFLISGISKIRKLEKEFEKTYKKELLKEIKMELENLHDIMDKIDEMCGKFTSNMIEILENLDDNILNYEKYDTFYIAMGRTQQYLSMVKKIKYKKNS